MVTSRGIISFISLVGRCKGLLGGPPPYFGVRTQLYAPNNVLEQLEHF
jgi:hypothetical protein